MRRFKVEVEESRKTRPVIRGTDANHMIKVLRLKVGDPVTLFDGIGVEYDARIEAIADREVHLSVLAHSKGRNESPVRISVAQGYLKDKKMDTLIRQLTELGISRWIPFFADRSVPRPDASRLARRMTRWQKIAIEALKQCRRSKAPQIEAFGGFEQMLATAASADVKIAFWEEETSGVLAADGSGSKAREIFIILGPEGGLTADEIQLARQAGFKAVSLGPRILRAETATVAACSLVQHIFGDMGGRGLSPP